MSDVPILWHLEVSPYNEKVRWVLDYKGVPHERRTVPPGAHPRKAQKLGTGKTFPVLVLDGKALGDSPEIVAAVEERWPDPPLYPSDPAEKKQALEVERSFGEMGHHLRRTLFIEWLNHPKEFFAFFRMKGTKEARAGRLAWPIARRQVARDYDVTEESARRGEQEVERAFELIETESADSGYLVGGSFSIADLTAAALLYPLVVPPGLQYQPGLDPADWPERTCTMRDRFARRPGFQWVQRMFAEHRPPSAAVKG